MSNINGWQPISKYNRNEYDWVLVKQYDNDFECIPQVAEMRSNNKWYDLDGRALPFEVKYFFDMQQINNIDSEPEQYTQKIKKNNRLESYIEKSKTI